MNHHQTHKLNVTRTVAVLVKMVCMNMGGWREARLDVSRVVDMSGHSIEHSDTLHAKIMTAIKSWDVQIQDNVNMVTDLRSSIYGETRHCFVPDLPMEDNIDTEVEDDIDVGMDVDF